MEVKNPYKTPKLRHIGGVIVLTKAAGSGDRLDASFPAGTKKADLGWTDHCNCS